MVDQATRTLSYIWHAPDKPLTIALNLDVVDRLGLAVHAGCQALPHRGLEIGGIVLGRIRRSKGKTTVEIEDFDLVESEHAAGPSYLLSAADRQIFESRIRQHQKSSRKLSVVGWFRSHTRRDFATTMEDTCLMTDFFPESSMVLLLIHANQDGPPKGGYYIWEGRNARMRRPSEQFPFGTAALMSGNYELYQRAPSTSRGRIKWPGVALPSLAFLAVRRPAGVSQLLQGATWLRAVKRPDFRIFRSWPKLWSGLTHWIRHSIAGFPWLVPKRMVLQGIPAVAFLAGAIASGVLYQGLHHDPTRAVGPRKPTVPTHAYIPPAPPRIPASASAAGLQTALPTVRPPTAVEEKPLLTAQPSEPSVVAVAPPATAKPISQDSSLTGMSARSVSRTPLRTMDLRKPAALSRSPKIPLLPDAPKVSNILMSDLDPLRESEIVRFAAPQIPDPLVTVSVETLPVSHSSVLPGKHPTGMRDKQARYIPPTLAREAPLNIPEELRHRIRRTIPINVKLYLDRSGKVQFAELLSNGTGSNRDLASMAVFSSRHCEFLPAHLGEKTVPAEVVLRYRFAPEPH
jgi:hypothetical protein